MKVRNNKPRRRRELASLPEHLNKRLAAYALAATAGLLTAAPAAQATIVHKSLNISVTPTVNIFGVYSRGSAGPIKGYVGFGASLRVPIAGLGATLGIRDDFEGGCLPDFPAGSCDREHRSEGRVYANSLSFIAGPGTNVHSQGVANLAFGAPISQNRPQSRTNGLLWYHETDPSGNSSFGIWLKGGDNLLGFIDKGHAGWVDLRFSGAGACLPGFRSGCFGGPGGITVTGYAYETVPGVAIRAGQMSDVPEPGTLTLLALGAIGLVALRKRAAARARHKAA